MGKAEGVGQGEGHGVGEGTGKGQGEGRGKGKGRYNVYHASYACYGCARAGTSFMCIIGWPMFLAGCILVNTWVIHSGYVRKRIYGSVYVPLHVFKIFHLSTLILEKSTLNLEKSTLNLEKSTLISVKSTLNSVKSTLNLEKSTLISEKSTLNLEKSTWNLEKSTLISVKSTLNSVKSTLNLEKSTLNLEKSTLNLEKSTMSDISTNSRQRGWAPSNSIPGSPQLSQVCSDNFNIQRQWICEPINWTHKTRRITYKKYNYICIFNQTFNSILGYSL